MSRQQQSDGKRFGKIILPLLLLVLVTLAAYMNAWPDNLTLDDKLIAVSGYFSGLSLSGALHFFNEDLWAVLGGNSGLYRPLLMVTIAMDAYIYGDWVAGYHLSNILLHLLVTLLVYGFIRHLLLVSGGQSPLSDHIALLAAMVFGVHPVHTEVVNSIFWLHSRPDHVQRSTSFTPKPLQWAPLMKDLQESVCLLFMVVILETLMGTKLFFITWDKNTAWLLQWSYSKKI